jgi:ferritin-like metal-binding protein YciE
LAFCRPWRIASGIPSLVISEEHDDGFLHQGHQVNTELFLHALQDVYYAEKQIVNSLPTMIEATNRELAKGLREHLKETEQQVTRLEKVFENLGESPGARIAPRSMD